MPYWCSTLVFMAILWRAEIALADEPPCYCFDDFSRLSKIDVHAHILSSNTDFLALSRQDRFDFVNMAIWSDSSRSVNLKNQQLAFLQYRAAPNRIALITSFPLDNWDAPDWSEQTIAYLKEAFDRGAVGVKVWKNIGMELRDAHGQLVMINDPKFDPVLDYIESRQKVLLGHLGEPKNCWLPLREMTTHNDRSYFAENPEFHMYLHPQMPSYEDQISARDQMLAKHPRLKFVGCHLASLEWSLARMSDFLDRFPNASLEVAARIPHLQYLASRSNEDRQAVIDFFHKYRTRLLYGTDFGIGDNDNVVNEYWEIRQRWLMDWSYFTSDHWLPVPEVDGKVQGLALPREVIDRFYFQNARQLFSGAWTMESESKPHGLPSQQVGE